MEYKIFYLDGFWKVYSGFDEYGLWVKDELVYWSKNIADCYAWVKAKQENLLGE